MINDVYHGRRGGWFVEAGAVDGILSSNTHLLESAYGWTGICVEPVPAFYEALRVNRKCHTFNCCLSDKAGDVSFTLNVTAPGTSSMPDSLSDSLKRLFYREGVKTQTIIVRARTLQDLLREVRAPKFIEYLSLDVEGAEDKVLRPFPFEEFTFGCLTVERGAQRYHELRHVLTQREYRLVRVGGMDDHFVHASVPYSAPLRDRVYAHVQAVGSRVKRLLKSR